MCTMLGQSNSHMTEQMQVPFPAELQAQQAAAMYQHAYPQRPLHEDLLTAHEHVGLLRQSGQASAR